jgi:1-acyl-sn-glycerol-3-phosphate acyltransferase
MGKAELFKNPIISWFFKKIGAFPVERGKGDTTAIQTAVEAVKNGEALMIFPEGTRSKTGELLRFKSGAGVIASQTEADILPVAINYSGKLKFRGKAVVTYLPVISYKDLAIDISSPRTIKAATTLIRETILNGLEENKI